MDKVSKIRTTVPQLNNISASLNTSSPAVAFRMKAFVLTPDANTGSLFTALFEEIGVTAEHCDQLEKAASWFLTDKFDALVLDFDNATQDIPDLKNVRERHSNRNAIVFAVATGAAARRRAFELGTSFVFERPLLPSRIAQVLRTAYGLMLRDRREYFRLSIELPVVIRRNSGIDLQCTTLNLSRTGMAVATPSPFESGESITLAFRIPTSEAPVKASGKIIWDDKHGKAGIAFECPDAEVESRFTSWLDGQFYTKFDIQFPQNDPE